MFRAGTGTSLSRTLCLASCLSGAALAAQPSGGPTAGQARRRLVEGNQRYVKGNMKACGASNAAARSTLATEQKPYAIILACSDSRVPPEIVFDEGLGQLFVIRVAGNVPDPVVLGSIEYAAEHLGSPLLIVLGHERCGAVTAAVDAHGQAPGHLAAIVKALGPAVTRARSVTHDRTQDQSRETLVEAAVVENAREVAAALPKQSPLLRRLVAGGKLEIVPARYDLDDGTVTMLDPPPATR